MIGNVLITYRFVFFTMNLQKHLNCALVVTVGHREIGNNFARLQNDVPLKQAEK